MRNIITNSVKIGFREINIDSTHSFFPHNIRIVIESFHIFGPNMYTNAFLRLRSNAPDEPKSPKLVHIIFLRDKKTTPL